MVHGFCSWVSKGSILEPVLILSGLVYVDIYSAVPKIYCKVVIFVLAYTQLLGNQSVESYVYTLYIVKQRQNACLLNQFDYEDDLYL